MCDYNDEMILLIDNIANSQECIANRLEDLDITLGVHGLGERLRLQYVELENINTNLVSLTDSIKELIAVIEMK